MNTTTRPFTTPTAAATPGAAWPSRLLNIGALAGPVFLVGAIAQLPLNPGFDMTRHAFSFLANGPHGWIQQIVFVISGLLNITSGVGLLQALTGRIRIVAAVTALVYGIGPIVSGIWPPAPSFGYPAGAPAGYPDTMTAASAMHAIGFTGSILSWVALIIILAVWMRRIRSTGWAITLVVTAVAVLLVPAVSGFAFGTIYLYAAVSSGLVVTAAALRRIAQVTR